MSGREANHFGKSLYKRLIHNQSQTERLFEQIYYNNVHNMENKITDEEAQERISNEIVNYTTDVSRDFSCSRENEMARGIIPYIMLEYVTDASAHIGSQDNFDDDRSEHSSSNSNSEPHKDFAQRFKENLLKLKPYILEKITKHWGAVAGSTVLGATAYVVTKFVLGCTANKAFLMGSSLGLAIFLGWEVYDHFTNSKMK